MSDVEVPVGGGQDILRYVQLGDVERLRLLLHEDATWTVVGTGLRVPGKAERPSWISFLALRAGCLWTATRSSRRSPDFPGTHCAVEARGLGRFKNGKEYNNHYTFFVEIKDDKVSPCASTWTATT